MKQEEEGVEGVEVLWCVEKVEVVFCRKEDVVEGAKVVDVKMLCWM